MIPLTANGTSVVNEDTGEKFESTALLGDEEPVASSVTLSTEGGVVDGDGGAVNEPMQWVVVAKDDKKID